LTLEQRVLRITLTRDSRLTMVLESFGWGVQQAVRGYGRASIAPEYMLRALLLQAFYSIRSEPPVVEQIDYNLLFRWFVGLGMTTRVEPYGLLKNPTGLLNSEVAQQFFAAVNQQAKALHEDDTSP